MQPIRNSSGTQHSDSANITNLHTAPMVLRSGKKVYHKTPASRHRIADITTSIIQKTETPKKTSPLASHTIVKLAPPLINRSTIAQEVVCTRPKREGSFNISNETITTKNGTKTCINCYGHGGAGFTTLFGSVKNAIDLFEKENPIKSTPIRIIGSGCMGLTSAIELVRHGYTVAGITTKNLYDLPSWKAAGYFAVVSVKTSKEEQENLKIICINTFKTYQQIEKGTHPYLTKEAVRYMPVYCSQDTESGLEDLEEQQLIPARELVTLDFGNTIKHTNFVRYMTYFMNTTTLMQQLTQEVIRLKIPIEQREIHSFDEVEEATIFNCSGLGGKELNHDDKMIPVRGHLVGMNALSGNKHMDYMIYTKVKQDDKEEYIYMFPKNVSVSPENTKGISCHGVLGGTFIPFVDALSKSEQEKLDKTEFQRMLDRNNLFFNGKLFDRG